MITFIFYDQIGENLTNPINLKLQKKNQNPIFILYIFFI